MKLRIAAFFFLSYSLLSKSLQAQHSSLHLKAGASSSLVIPSSGTRSEIYRLTGNRMPLPVLAVEWRKPLKYKQNDYALLTTLGLNPWRSTFAPNEVNMQSRNVLGLAAYDYSLQFSTAIEKKFQPKSKIVGKNYFSAFLGAGLNFNISDGDENPDNRDGIWTYNSGITKKGEQIVGSRFYHTHSNFLTPVVVGGLRYHILNRKGVEIMDIELASRYALGKFFDWGVRYEKNGIMQTDYLTEKGFNIQLTLIIKLATFGKKKHK